MTTVQVGEREQRLDGSFTARVVFEEGVEYEVTVADPADDVVERELAWYFEEHLRFPFLDQDREGGLLSRSLFMGGRCLLKCSVGLWPMIIGGCGIGRLMVAG